MHPPNPKQRIRTPTQELTEIGCTKSCTSGNTTPRLTHGFVWGTRHSTGTSSAAMLNKLEWTGGGWVNESLEGGGPKWKALPWFMYLDGHMFISFITSETNSVCGLRQQQSALCPSPWFATRTETRSRDLQRVTRSDKIISMGSHSNSVYPEAWGIGTAEPHVRHRPRTAPADAPLAQRCHRCDCPDQAPGIQATWHQRGATVVLQCTKIQSTLQCTNSQHEPLI